MIKLTQTGNGIWEATIEGHKVEAIRMDSHSNDPADARTWILAIDEQADEVYSSRRAAIDAAEAILSN